MLKGILQYLFFQFIYNFEMKLHPKMLIDSLSRGLLLVYVVFINYTREYLRFSLHLSVR